MNSSLTLKQMLKTVQKIHSLFHLTLSKGTQFFVFFLFIATGSLIINTPVPCPAEIITDAEHTQQNEISNYRIKISRLQKGIDNQETSINQTKNKELNILGELETLDKKLGKQKEKLQTLEEKKAKQQERINSEETALAKVYSQKKLVEKHLKKRIIAYYKMGDIGLLNVTFSTKTLPELLKFHDAFNSLIKYDKHVIEVYKETIKKLESTKQLLTLEKGVLLDFIQQTEAETVVLEETKAKKTILLTLVRTQTKLHQQAAREMQVAAEKLSLSIVAIKNKNQFFEQGFLLNKGSIPPPIDGTLITLFQQEKKNRLGIDRKSNGIELKAPNGTKVIAVESGTVIFSGYLRGYGNTVIIHHGFQYFTVTSRIEKIMAHRRQEVKTGDTIGIVGDTAMLFDEGLYFEIRHGKQSLDPLLWLNPNRLSTLHELPAENLSE